ncbi:hypothetical protein HYX02_08280 [Candidatus Woesearchaeota archaeon]|nr:hypothetical protein [Candidatus Woesearchaeota archaeon]
MDKNRSLMLAAVVFGLVAFLHLLRAIFSWPARIADFDVPLWLSYVAVVVAGYLSWLMYSASKKK